MPYYSPKDCNEMTMAFGKPMEICKGYFTSIQNYDGAGSADPSLKQRSPPRACKYKPWTPIVFISILPSTRLLRRHPEANNGLVLRAHVSSRPLAAGSMQQQDLKRLFNSAISSALRFLRRLPAPLVMSSPRHSTTGKHLKGFSLDKRYYIPGADLHLKVEHTLFRVHSYFFHRESPHYRQKMAGEEDAKTHDGLSDKTAIPVKDVSVEEFSHFLWVIYNPDYAYPPTPASVWGIILTLSSPSNWDFPKMHNLAFNQLTDLKMAVVERIVLYQQSCVQIDRLLPLYAELCLREESLTYEESIRLGHKLTVPINHVREPILQGRRTVGGDNQSSGMNPHKEDLTISKEEVMKRLKLALEDTGASASALDLSKFYQCPTAHPSACGQSHKHHKPSLRVRYNKQATTNTLSDVMIAESSTQGRNRSIPLSSSKGKGPENIQEDGSPGQDQEQLQCRCCGMCSCMSWKRSSGFILVEKSISAEEFCKVLPGSWQV